MIILSLKEMILIGSITIIFTLIVITTIYYLGDEDIKRNNILYNSRNRIKFYILLFTIGILLYIGLQTLDINNWYCDKVCDINGCNIICKIPINNITNILLAK